MMRDHPLSYADNDEIAMVCRISNKDYYVVGEHPFGDFTVAEYVRYSHSLVGKVLLTKSDIKGLLSNLGVRVNLKTHLNKLDFITRRLVCLCTKIQANTTSLAINLDGVPFSRKLKRKIRRCVRVLGRRYTITFALTDARLARKGSKGITLKLGAIYTSQSYAKKSKRIKRSRFKKLLARLPQPIPPLEQADIVCV